MKMTKSCALRVARFDFNGWLRFIEKRPRPNAQRETDGSYFRTGMSMFVLLVFSFCSSSCGVYSFSGASIPAHVSTISIPLLEDQSRSGQPSLAEDLTDELLDQFVQRTRLELATDEESADLILLGTIQRYRNEPTAVTGDEAAALSRVSLQVQIVYVDQTKDSETLNRSFSSSANYDPIEDGLDGELLAIEEAIETLAGDIFTAATSDW